MILTRSTRLFQPQGPVEISPDFGGAGVVYLPNVRSGIARVAGTVARSPTQQGVSAVYTAGVENKIERLNGSAPNGVTEYTQLIYFTPNPGGSAQDRGLFTNRNTNVVTSFLQLVHRARDAASVGRFCYVLGYKPTSSAAEAILRTPDYSAVDGSPAFLLASVKNGAVSLYLNGVKHGSVAADVVPISGQADLQIGNYYDNTDARRLSAQIHLGAFLPRGVSDVEAFALSKNPWQLFRPVQRRVYFDMGAGGGGTSTVTSDLLSSYNIRGAVAADSSHDYSVRGAVAAPIGAAYDIRGSVFANLGASYGVRGSAITDLSASYTVRGSAGADSDVSYAVRGAVHAAASPAYDIRGSVTSDLSAAYDILSATSVVADSACAYSIRGTTYATTSPAYDIRGAVGSDLSAAYDIRSTAFADLSATYDIDAGVASVYADLTTSYFIDGAVHSGGLSPSDLAAIRVELAPELAAIFQIQTKVDAAL